MIYTYIITMIDLTNSALCIQFINGNQLILSLVSPLKIRE